MMLDGVLVYQMLKGVNRNKSKEKVGETSLYSVIQSVCVIVPHPRLPSTWQADSGVNLEKDLLFGYTCTVICFV